jgi:SAM-dependent methyltransferase
VSTTAQDSAYNQAFYQAQGSPSYSSARKILQLLWAFHPPGSIVDVGCGTGSWCKAAGELGVSDYAGVEGPWLKPEMALIPFERIRHHDLRLPLDLGRRYDLAISMEVAEHLPESAARTFVGSLTKLAPVVLFSAAAPMQGGVEHVNEQWPAYWTTLFLDQKFTVIDGLRRLVWDDPEVRWWYAQNVMVYVEESFLAAHRVLQAWKADSETPGDKLPLAMVHPGRLLEKPRFKDLLKQLPGAFRTALHRRLGTTRLP